MDGKRTARALRILADEIEQSEGPEPVRWEYKELRKREAITAEELNELGKEGWQLVTVSMLGDFNIGAWAAFLMRPVQA
jgi:hypothetical protein